METVQLHPNPKAKQRHIGTSYRPIALLSPMAKVLERIILNKIVNKINLSKTQHGFRKEHSTSTALHEITATIAAGFNKSKPPDRTIAIQLDMSKAFDTVNHNKLMLKLMNTDIPATYTKYINNYIKGRVGYVSMQGVNSRKKLVKLGIPQGSVLSPMLFNIYMSDIPVGGDGVKITSYADDITILASHKDIPTATSTAQSYLDKVLKWAARNNLEINPAKTTCTLFTPDPAKYSQSLDITINKETIRTVLPKTNIQQTHRKNQNKSKQDTEHTRKTRGNRLGSRKRTTHKHLQSDQ